MMMRLVQVRRYAWRARGGRLVWSTAGISTACEEDKMTCRFSSGPNRTKVRSSFPSVGFGGAHSASYFSTSAVAQEDNNNKLTPFLLADIGEGIHEVELLKWHVKPGDVVQQFDPVCLVQSDKATVEITSRYDGTVHSLATKSDDDDEVVEEGDMIAVGSPLIYIATSDDADDEDEDSEEDAIQAKDQGVSASSAESTVSPASETFQESAAGVQPSKVLASPAVRAMCQQHNLDMSQLHGTGPDGRILKSDIQQLLHAQPKPHPPPTLSSPPSTPVDSISTTNDIHEIQTLLTQGQTVIQPLRGYHRHMYQTMTASLQIPHMGLAEEVNVSQLHQCRHDLHQQLKMQQQHPETPKLTYLVFAIKAASLALQRYPILNSSLLMNNNNNNNNNDDDNDNNNNNTTPKVQYHPNHNIGLAMDTPRGLAVAVVHNVQSLTLLEIHAELSRLKSLAQQNLLSAQDVTGTTFSLSNIGAIGGTYARPVIAPPQVGIGALGRVHKVPRFVNDDDGSGEEGEVVKAVHVMHVSWAADHRVVDGGTLARFHNAWKGYMECPASMMLYLR